MFPVVIRSQRYIVWFGIEHGVIVEHYLKFTEREEVKMQQKMLEQLDFISNIYDLMALCCSYILKEMESVSYELARFNDEEYVEVENALISYNEDREEYGRKKAFQNLKLFIYQYLRQEVTVLRCYAIVYFIDDNVEVDFHKENGTVQDNIFEYSEINSQYKDRIRIIPKLNNTLLEKISVNNVQDIFRKRREAACSKIDEQMVNYSIWDASRIEQYPLKIYHVEQGNFLYEHFYHSDRLVFGIFPVTCEGIDKILDIKREQRVFNVIGMHAIAEKYLADRYTNILNRYKDVDMDFLIFPELLFTEKISEVLKEYGNEIGLKTKFVINGSVWKNKENKCVVTDGKGHTIFEYRKKRPFIIENKYKEELDQQKNKEFSILEIDGIGRIGICICKDLIDENVKSFHKYMRTNILIVPAFTGSMDLQSAGMELSMDYDCIVIVANACSAIDKESEKSRIGFITCPGKKNTDRTPLVRMYYQNECKKDCHKECAGKVFAIDFQHIVMDDGILSFAIKEIVS